MLSTRELVHTAIARSVQQLMANEGTVRTTDDPDAVHDARVATRRLRSDLRTFRPVLDRRWSEPLRDELQWLGRLLGNVRDADVLHELLVAKAGNLPSGQHTVALRLAARLRSERAEDRESLLEAMRSDRYLSLLERLAGAADPAITGRQGKRSARKAAPRLVRKPWRRLRQEVRALSSPPTDEELHTVRKRAKSARYAAEAVTPAVGRPAKRFAKRMEAIQDVLGNHQDLVVADMWLADVVHDIEDSEEAFVAGRLDTIINLEREDVRGDWPRAWKAADAKSVRDWL